MTATIRYGMNAIIGILAVLAVGYWFIDRWMDANLEGIIEGEGMGQSGLIVQRADEYFEGNRRLPLGELLYHPTVLDDRRHVALKLVTDLTDLLDPGEALPAPHLLPLLAEARAARLVQDRCGDWLAGFATRCLLTKATVTDLTDGTTKRPARVTIEARFAVIPRDPDPAPLLDRSTRIDKAEVRFTLPTTPLTEADRAGVLALAHTAYRDACAEVRAAQGNCGFWWIEFTETRRPDGTLTLSGGANLGYLRAAGGS
jgi:hypothetical protein